MIRKFLVCGKKQILLQSRNQDALADLGRVVEVILPIDMFWKIESEVKKLDYLLSSDSQDVDLGHQYRRIIKLVTIYAASQLDRDWLYALNSPQKTEPDRRRPSSLSTR
ncbi:MAG: hypothetical protein H7249_13945 [Chitinophagaceae bacterium]|nr:hypothetical protein [Oligoflexus sp.]